MNCIEVLHDQGYIELIPAAEVEQWDEVANHVEVVTDHGELTGWGQWTRLLEVVDEFGNPRFYFLNETT